jgi:superfamily I DNA and/or RNA helicase
MNVALTRAKRLLLLVADSATLGDHPYYASLIEYLDEIDAHGSAWSDDAEPL